MPSLQQRYFDLLIERVSTDRYPSHQMLDRIESSFWTPEQIAEYVEVLLEKVDESWYPSHQMLDRIERIFQMAAMVA
jgi:hypothetical protein